MRVDDVAEHGLGGLEVAVTREIAGEARLGVQQGCRSRVGRLEECDALPIKVQGFRTIARIFRNRREIVGVLGVRQVRGMRRSEWANTRVADVMVKPPQLVLLGPDEPMQKALERVHRANVDGLPVVEDGRLVGMLTRLGVGMFLKARQAEQRPR